MEILVSKEPLLKNKVCYFLHFYLDKAWVTIQRATKN